MPTSHIIDAMTAGLCVELRYHNYLRLVEAHAFGRSHAGHDVIRVWQVSAGSVSNEPIGWKLFRLDEARGVHVSEQTALAPRPGYRKGDRAMALIYFQLEPTTIAWPRR
jgi:hypothetical protein